MQPISKEMKERAQQVNLVGYLQAIGVPIIKEGKEYRLKKHDSLTINPVTNLWDWNSQSIGGKNAIDYLERVEKKGFIESVAELLQYENALPQDPEIQKEILSAPRDKSHEPFVLPPPAENNRRVFAYLCRERKILPAVVNHFIKTGDLYEDAEHHNAVFIGRDEKEIPRYAHKRSTNTLIPSVDKDGKKRKNRWDVAGSDKSCGFKHIGTSARLFIFEAPIDMLSFISLRELTQPSGTWKHDSYLALGGVSDCALAGFLKGHPAGKKIRYLTFCLDSDEPGQNAAKLLRQEFGIAYRTSIKVPTGKDFNDMLKSINNIRR